jgi:hypothetical protein
MAATFLTGVDAGSSQISVAGSDGYDTLSLTTKLLIQHGWRRLLDKLSVRGA